MKNLNILIVILIISIQTVYSQNNKETKEISILTTATCGNCEAKIGNAIKFEKGIKSYEFSEDSKTLTVKYKPGKINEATIKEIIGDLGYLPKEDVATKTCGKGAACCANGKTCSKKKKTSER